MASSNVHISALMTPELQGVFENLPFPISYAELGENPPRVAFVNKAFKRIFGYDLAEISNMEDWSRLAYPDPSYREAVMGSWTKDAEIAYQTQGTVPIREVEITAKNGQTITTLLNGSFVGTSLVVAFIDISQQVRAEAELRDVRNQLKQTAYELTENLPVGTYTMVLPPGGTLAQFNFLSPQFLVITGLKREDVLADPLLAFSCIHPDDYDRWLALNVAAFEQKIPFFGEARLCTHNDVRWIAAESKPRDLEDGSTVWEGVIIDITDRKRAEESLERARAKAEQLERIKTDFLTRMSHEIRTPLTMMMGLTDLLGDECQTPSQAEKIDQLRAASELLMGIVNDILDLSKIEAGQLITEELPFNLSQLAGHVQAFSALVTQPQVAYSVDIEPDPTHRLIGDRRRIEQILGNLVNNAIKFTQQGSIQVSLRLLNATEETVTLRGEVVDTGCGITEQQLPLLFSPFIQGDQPPHLALAGTGLGLSISKELVSLMGGEIGVHSEPDVGSQFWFELPLAYESAAEQLNRTDRDDNTPPSQPLIDDSEQLLAGLHVLVVDDSRTIRELICAFLRRAGATAEWAEQGEIAIEKLTQNPHGFDCIMMDVQMPVMDGLTAAQTIRNNSQLEHIPILAMTAGILAEQQIRARRAGMTDVIAKPVQPARMVQQILKATKKAEAQRKLQRSGAIDLPKISGIDRAHVGQTMAGSLEMFDWLSGVFLEEYQSLSSELDALLEAVPGSQDWQSAIRMAHSLQGSSAQLGAFSVSRAALSLQRALERSDPNSRRHLYELNAELQPLLAALAAYRGVDL